METPQYIKEETFQYLLDEYKVYTWHDRRVLKWILTYLTLSSEERAEFTLKLVHVQEDWKEQ